jgi:hypothetical protein
VTLLAAAAVSLATNATSATGTCVWPALSQKFLEWSDTNDYFLLPDANFEGSVGGWTLAGDAGIAPGNESHYVGSTADTKSLGLPTTTSTITTPTICVTSDSPKFRFFLRNNGLNGHTDGQLAVYLNFTGADGKPQKVKIAGLKATTSWTLSPTISFIQYISTPLKSGTAQISFTIKPNDNHGNWQIDDIYVDPFRGR